MSAPILDSSSGCQPVDFTFDLSLYRLSAIQKAAYRFTGSYVVELNRVGEAIVRVRLVPCPGIVPVVAAAEFPNEVLDQELREVVADETRTVRELLLAQTFSSFSLTDPDGESSDYHDDPLRIAESRHSSR